MPRSGSSRLVWIFLTVVVVALAGWLWSKRGSESAAAVTEGTQIKSTLHLETFVLNLAGPNQKSYLRVGIDPSLKDFD